MPTRPAFWSRFVFAKATPSPAARTRYRDAGKRVLGVVLLAYAALAGANQIDIIGPAGSVAFGNSVTVLPNGNIVVTDRNGPGSVYLYSPTGVLISTLTGSTLNDQIGSAGVTVLSNGNYVIASPLWDNGPADVGAVTWGNADTGVSGVISASNSLVGTTAGDQVGISGVTVLSNGNYVVRSSLWDSGALVDVGAVTWGNANTGVSGAVSVSNSLIGTAPSDRVGLSDVTVLSNANYVVSSPDWDSTVGLDVVDAGAATWGNGSTGTRGVITASNSLTGSTSGDRVGSGGATALTNGNFVVSSSNWDNGAVADAGAATWGNGSVGTSGAVSTSNSIVGTAVSDRVGSAVTALSNGNYVIQSFQWNNGGFTSVGAATWGNGASGTTGTVSPSNSLIGTTANDLVGISGVTALSNGNYVVQSAFWNNGVVVDGGAATWGNGTIGTTGAVSPSNSLVGTRADDFVGERGVTALSNGNYVVGSPRWDNVDVVSAGAATWGNGSTGTSGAVSPSNSLVGSTFDDRVGGSVIALSNGNYVVATIAWHNGAALKAGAATWGNGSTGTSGAVSASNSLVGTKASDFVGDGGVIALSNGNYVIGSDRWDNGAAADVGAATWGNGSTGTSGAVSPTNSLVGTKVGDSVGRVSALSNGNYVVRSPRWDNGAVVDVGAVTWGNGSIGTSGSVSLTNSLVGTSPSDLVGFFGVTALNNGRYAVYSPEWNNGAVSAAGAVTVARGAGVFAATTGSTNSVLGTVANQGRSMVFGYDAARDQLVVGRPASNIVSIFHDRHAPVAVNDTLAASNEDTPRTIPAAALLGNDTDADGDTLSIATVTSGIGGTVALNAGNVDFTPTPNFTGTASFTYTASDGTAGSNAATVTFAVVSDAMFKDGFENPPPPAAEFAKVIPLAATDSGRATLELIRYGDALTAEAWAAVILVNGAKEMVAAFEMRQAPSVEVRLARVDADGWHYGAWTPAAADALLTLNWSSHDGVRVDRLGVEGASRRVALDAPR